MKRKILSLVLCFTLLFTCLFSGFTVVSAEDAATTEEFFVNGDFEEYEGTTPTNWIVKTPEEGTTTVEVVEDVEIAEGVTANAVKFTSTAEPSGEKNRSQLVYDGSVPIEKNAKYTISYWVKVKNSKGLRAYMFEPNYIDKEGNPKTNKMAQEGGNIYTYGYDAGLDANGKPITRVIRKDITHNFKIAETGTAIDQTGASMFIARSGGVEQVLTPDYPATERQGEWLQVVHTFETKNNDAHKADVSYQFTMNSAADGEVWIADVQMSVERFYVGNVNDNTLGAVAPGRIPVTIGQKLTLTAEPFGTNNFEGWYVGEELVSEEPTLTFNFEGKNTPDYVAHFSAGAVGVAENFEEGFANGQTIAQATNVTGSAADTEAGYTEFVNTQVEGNGYYIDSIYTGNWRKATISNVYAQSGSYSLKYFGAYGMIGRKFTGLEKNTRYTVSVYGYLTSTPSTDWAGVGNVIVTPADASYRATDKRLAASSKNNADVNQGWSKIEVTFDSGDNTEVIFWLEPKGKDANLYLDNYSIVREAVTYTPKVNDKTLGDVNTVKTRPGTKTTIIATAYGEAVFDGWYNGEELLSKNAKHTFVYSDEAVNYEARFSGTGFGINGSFEVDYENGKKLAEAKHNSVVNAEGTDWTPELWKETSLDGNNEYFIESNNGGNFRRVSVSNAYAYEGKYSLKFEGLWGYMGRKITGLQKNTDYIFTFYMLVTGNEKARINKFIVTDTNTAPVLPTGKDIATENTIAVDHTSYGKLNEWVKATYTFNSGDNEDVIVWLFHNETGAIYIDNMEITRTANVKVENSAYGSATAPAGMLRYNQKITVNATPYEGNTFDGWYVNDELVSSNAEYTFLANGNIVLTPKFSGNTYEHFAYNGMDGTFENGSVDGIEFYDEKWTYEWCYAKVSTKYAYEGNNSLEVNGRHRTTIVPLTNLDKNTNYTLSFYFFLNETLAPVEMKEGAELRQAQVAAGVTTADLKDIAKGSLSGNVYAPSEAKWQKVEVKFNSGNNTELNLILKIANENPQAFTYIDNLELIHGDYVAPEITTGDVDNDETINLNDLVALAQFVAEWEGLEVNEAAADVNGDGEVDLNDITHLAQYLAGWDVTLAQDLRLC